MLSIIGWILWALVGVSALFYFASSILNRDEDQHSRHEIRLQATLWAIGFIATAVLPVSKFHLVWIWPLGWVIPLGIEELRLRRAGKGIEAEAVRRHLEEESGEEVWNYSEMKHVFRVYAVTSPEKHYADVLRYPEFEWWWVAKESGIGQVKVIRRADKAKGTLLFKDYPRLYFNWSPDDFDKVED